MEKNTVSNFLWIIVTAIIMFALIAIASPFGVYLKNNLETFAGDYVEENDYSDEDLETDIITIDVKYYKVDEGESTFLTSTQQKLKKYEKYYIPTPEIEGYGANKSVVEGIATKDLEQVVQYTKKTYQIVYILNDGKFSVPLSDIPSTYIYRENPLLPDASKMLRENYVFDGWYENSEFKGDPITCIDDCKEPFGNKVFYAKWKGSTFNITYYLNDRPNEYNNKNGAYYYQPEATDSIATWNKAVLKEGSTTQLKDEYTTYTYGVEQKLPTSLHKHGYTFLGWSTKPNDPDVNVPDINGEPRETKRTQITASDYGDIILYAQWKRNTYNITYHTDFKRADGNEGKFTANNSGNYTITHSYNPTPTVVQGYPTEFSYGDSFTLPTADTLSAEGYTASVWYNVPTELAIGSMQNGYPLTYTPDAIHKTKVSPPTEGFRDSETGKKYEHTDLHLYVKAVPNKYTVTFVRNCPSDATNYIGDTITSGKTTQSFSYDKKVSLNTNPFVVYGHKFIGWSTTPQNGAVVYKDKEEVLNLTAVNNGNVTLYARWERVNVPVVINYFYQSKDKTYPTIPSSTSNLQLLTNTSFDIFTYINKNTKDGYIFSHGYSYLANKTADKLQSFDDKATSPCNIKVVPNQPNGALTVNIYYERNVYELTLVTNTPSSVSAATATAEGTNYNFKANSVKIEVPYGSTVKLTQTHNLTYKIKNWTIVNSSGTTKNTNATLNYTMPAKDTTITLYSENDTFSIVYHRTFTALPDKTKTLTLKLADSSTKSYATCISNCANKKTGSTYNQFTCDHIKVDNYKFNEALNKLPTITASFKQDNRKHFVQTNWQYTPSGATEISSTTKINKAFLEKDGVVYDEDTKTLHVYAEWTYSTKDSDHTYKQERVEPTCTKDGSVSKVCEVCGYRPSSQTISRLGHLRGPAVLKQKATCYRGPLYYYYCQRCNYHMSSYRNDNAKTAHNSNPSGQCGSTHKVTWSDVCTGADYSHSWGTCKEILCHNASFDSNGTYVLGCGKANSKKLWCGTHGRGTRHTWTCGSPNRIENGARVNGEKVRPNGKSYVGKKSW